MLKVDNLTKTLDNFKLQDISFHLPKGYICGLIGENGAGKTTLIKLLIGLYKRDRGSGGDITINGYSMDEDEARMKEGLGLIHDESMYDKRLSLEQIGLYYGEFYCEFDMKKYLGYLDKFGLDSHQRYRELSKGMEIKTQLAFALSHNAKMFIFDEPTSGLDKSFREEFIKICADIVSDGERSILISSHITEDLDRIADYIAYMQEGKILFFTTKEALCDKFLIVQGEDYKCNLISKDAVIYKETGEYSSRAMIINSKRFAIDAELETKQPDIREFMHYFVKGGKQNAEAIAEKYLQG